ncbi:MAG: NADH:ubiquinone oxidoreductase [Peltula sp. TS41687]|nr:MAG: NADH:ubiquinone oxidoreductase [Peltula sp. TS41687]
MGTGEGSPSLPSQSMSGKETLDYYKAQYEQLENELAEFQTSSRELEAELEKDIEASEKRERKLQEKVESLGFEVEEWKTKYKQCKSEANAVQNTLQKEITVLRDTNRTTQLRLRDIEVANDDIERQARNTSSSLEDLESKYNVAIERAVMLEAEIHIGEQEREALRIEAQRLRDELSDLRIEAEITQEKLRRMEVAATNSHLRPLPTKTPDRPRTSPSEHSPASSPSSPTRSTPPPPKSSTTSVSDAPTPPSPPISESSINAASTFKTPNKFPKPKIPSGDVNATPRPSHFQQRLPRLSYGQPHSMTEGDIASAVPRRISSVRPMGAQNTRIPPSSSLRQIRGLIGQMQRLEQRVHSARSKLPGSAPSPVASTPHSRSSSGHDDIPASITVRSHKKRTGGSISDNGQIRMAGEMTPSSTSHLTRPSFGFPTPQQDRVGTSRPASRASTSSRTSSIPYHTNPVFQRPSSRASITGTRTPLSHYSTSIVSGEARRPRSSIGGSYAAVHGHHAHSHSSSVSGLEEKPFAFATPPPRRSTLNKADAHLVGGSGIPTPSGLSKRQSGALRPAAEPPATTGMAITPRLRKTTSQGVFATGPDRDREMGPPERRKKLSGVGEV